MNVNLIRLKGVVKELHLIRAEIARANDLKELELQHVYGLTTRVVKASEKDLRDTEAAYSDPDYALMAAAIERHKGAPLDERDEELILEALASEPAES